MSNPKTKTSSSPRKPAPPQTAADAFARVQSELDDLPGDRIAGINLDIPQAVSIALGAIPAITALRPEIARRLPEHPLARIDRLETYALAAWYAHLLALPGAGPENPVKPLLEEAAPLRENLLNDAEALARRGLLDATTIADIRKDHGNIDTANDLVALSAVFMTSWERIENKTAATLEEVKRAGQLGPLLLAALGVRAHGVPVPPAAAADTRARAFTLFTSAYDQARRAVSYLRWDEGDADVIAPSLYKGRGGRGTPARDPGETPPEGDPPAPAGSAPQDG